MPTICGSRPASARADRRAAARAHGDDVNACRNWAKSCANRWTSKLRDARARRVLGAGDASSRPQPTRRLIRSNFRSTSIAPRAGCSSVVRALPALLRARGQHARHASRLRCAAAYVGGMGFDVLYLPPIHPIGRERRKGRTTRSTPAPDDVGSPWAIGAAEGGHKAIHPELGTLDDFRRFVARAASSASRSRSTSRSNARRTIRTWRAPGVVPQAAGRHRPVRREPAEEVPGHLSVQLRIRGLAGAVARARERVRVLDRRGRAHIPRRQPAHQAVPVLGMGDRRDQARASGRDLPLGGIHAPEGDAPAGQARLHAVVHVLHLAQHQAGAHRILHRADARTGARILPPELLAEHARHPARASADRRPAGVHGAARAGGDAGRELRHLRPGVRAARARAARARRRGVSRLREVRAAPLGPGARRTAWRRSSPASMPRAATIRRCKRDDGLRFVRSTTTS